MSNEPIPAATTAAAPPEVTVVSSVGCHFCADADTALAEIAAQFPMTVRRVPMTSPEGTGLMQRHRAAMSPLVLLDGAFISAGRLSRGRLRKALAARGSVPAGSGARS